MTLADRLRSIAQNDYMIDQYFLETGHELNEIGNEVDKLEAKIELLKEIAKFWIDRYTAVTERGGTK